MAPQLPRDEVKTSVHGNQGPAWSLPAYIYSIVSPHSSTKHQCYWSPTLQRYFLLRCLCLCWSSYGTLFLPLTIWANPSQPSMDLSALLWSFPWPSPPRHIQGNTHYFVPPRFPEPPSVRTLSIGHYANSFSFLFLLLWATWSRVLFTVVNEKAKALMAAKQGLCDQAPTVLPTSPPTILLLAHFDPATKTCFHANLPDTFLSRAIALGGSTAQNALA